MTKHYPPKFSASEFNCPHCGVYALHFWWAYLGAANDTTEFEEARILDDLCASRCVKCGTNLIWNKASGTIAYPVLSQVALPSEDMPADVSADYEEAARVLHLSPRSAAALLRLALQKLLPHLEQPGKNINAEIANLVRSGLPIEVQQALDALRVIGNESVHPGELDIRDDVETAAQLFDLLNFIVEDKITRPKRVRHLYNTIPQSARDAIEKRDNPVAASAPKTPAKP